MGQRPPPAPAINCVTLWLYVSPLSVTWAPKWPESGEPVWLGHGSVLSALSGMCGTSWGLKSVFFWKLNVCSPFSFLALTRDGVVCSHMWQQNKIKTVPGRKGTWLLFTLLYLNLRIWARQWKGNSKPTFRPGLQWHKGRDVGFKKAPSPRAV